MAAARHSQPFAGAGPARSWPKARAQQAGSARHLRASEAAQRERRGGRAAGAERQACPAGGAQSAAP